MQAWRQTGKGPVRNILIAQDVPAEALPPYTRLAEKFDVQIDFRSFVNVEPVRADEFRRQKIDISDYSAVILASRHATDHFFRVCEELRIGPLPDMNYFCLSEQIANYLQKYIVVRRRKVFVAGKGTGQLVALLKKHNHQRYLFPCSDVYRGHIVDILRENNLNYVEAVMYRAASAALADLPPDHYDIIAIFSPSGVSALVNNFPSFSPNRTALATFGETTARAARDAGLALDIEAPLPNVPSMTGALELYIQKANASY